MWRLGLTKESEDFLGEVLSSIQMIVSALKDDDVIPHGAFWLSTPMNYIPLFHMLSTLSLLTTIWPMK